MWKYFYNGGDMSSTVMKTGLFLLASGGLVLLGLMSKKNGNRISRYFENCRITSARKKIQPEKINFC
ncbi:MAG: hypothetical protein A2220_12855 [Ignavibacteria bacterium RIFOXYA2_FULL_35_10]|nr:MAG: hypothetical protein A2220_12855 [Ignavibacteria bacterium RIFOXYA2_FULL_35_10]